MKKFLSMLVLASFSFCGFAQNGGKISGAIQSKETGKNIESATIYLLKAVDSSLIKAAVTDKEGIFIFENVKDGTYLISATSVGYSKIYSGPFEINPSSLSKEIGVLQLNTSKKDLAAVTVISKKPLIEIKADKIVFNVESSINSTGSNALELLQKSPGILVDNNDNISMKGKSGVKIYVDGKMTQLDTKSLADYLRGINSSDIESIEMISNPGAKYDASGNAGVINIRLKKNKKFGTNGNTSIGYAQGKTPKGDASVSLNYRNKKINIFSNVSGSMGNYENALNIYRIQSDSIYDQHTLITSKRKNANIKAGVDYFINNKNTVGFLVTSNFSNGSFNTAGNTLVFYRPTNQFIKTLEASNHVPGDRTNANFNINYRYADTSGKEISFDGDYGLFRSSSNSYQPNDYYGADKNLLYSIITGNNAPTNIDIYTAKLDVEQKFLKGKIGYGAKFAYVKTDNVFDFFNYENNVPVKSLDESNGFVYIENVNAAYINYNREFNSKWSLQAGLRMEQTNSKGSLTRANDSIAADDVVKRSYVNLFPSAALSYNVNEKNSIGLTYSRRIDRPDYQDLNPFENKLDQLTYEKGNAFLKPQYTDNVEINHTYKSKLITTFGYSHVKDYTTQVTTAVNGNATFVQQKNIATQQLLSFNMGTPLKISKWWNGYASIWYNYQFVKGAYNNYSIRVSSSNYGAYMQHSFTLGKDYSSEISGWYNGPGLEGTWKRKAMGGMDAGIQKLFLKKRASLKLSVTDIFHTIKFKAESNFGGTNLHIDNSRESRTVRLNFSYRFGNSQVKAARQHKTGLESEGNRIK